MAILLKIRWDIRKGSEQTFRDSQQRLAAVMASDHPGVLCYHVDYPEPNVSEWTEIYANDAVFKAHLDNGKAKEPLAGVIAACENIACRCWGDPNAESKEILAGFGTTYHETAKASYVLHPAANPASPV